MEEARGPGGRACRGPAEPALQRRVMTPRAWFSCMVSEEEAAPKAGAAPKAQAAPAKEKAEAAAPTPKAEAPAPKRTSEGAGLWPRPGDEVEGYTGDYRTYFDKRGHRVGIRMHGGSKRQVLSFGGLGGGAEAELRAVGKQAVKKLKEGASCAETRTWCFGEISLSSFRVSSGFHSYFPSYI